MEQIRSRFAKLVEASPDALAGTLDVGALLIAAAVDPTVVLEDQLARLDTLARRCPASTASGLARWLFEPDPGANHFEGNRADYYDADNSLLNRVLDRRLGIPISLSVLMIEVGRRHGIELVGVGMPGHFLVGFGSGFFDPFHGGTELDEPGCQQLFRRLAGPQAVLSSDALDATPHSMILKRMLFNLAGIAGNIDDRRLARSTRSLLASYPDASGQDHVQHAYAAAAIAQYDEAAVAAATALPLVPERVHDKLGEQIVAWQAQLN